MAFPLLQPLGDQIETPLKINEFDLRIVSPQDLTVSPLKCGAREDMAGFVAVPLLDRRLDTAQPRLAILVGQGVPFFIFSTFAAL
jgi:hypothetical protein